MRGHSETSGSDGWVLERAKHFGRERMWVGIIRFGGRGFKKISSIQWHVGTRGAEGARAAPPCTHTLSVHMAQEKKTCISRYTKAALNEDNGLNRTWHFENTAPLSHLHRHLVCCLWVDHIGRLGGVWPQSSSPSPREVFSIPKIIFNATFLSARAHEILTSHVFFNCQGVISDCSNTLVEFEEKLWMCYNSFPPTPEAVASARGLPVFTPDRIRVAYFPEYLFWARLLICNSSVCSMCSQQTDTRLKLMQHGWHMCWLEKQNCQFWRDRSYFPFYTFYS